MTMYRERRAAEDAFRAGVSGCLLKEPAGEESADATEQVYNGKLYLTPLSSSPSSSIADSTAAPES